MKKGAKKEMKNQIRQDKKGWKAKTTAHTPSPTKVSAKPESIISIPKPTATSLIENSSEQPKKKKKKKKKDKEGEKEEKEKEERQRRLRIRGRQSERKNERFNKYPWRCISDLDALSSIHDAKISSS